MNLSSIIDNQKKYADYIVKEITYICKNIGKRETGSEGEKQA